MPTLKLVMDSRKSLASLRNHHHMGTWSQLYKSGSFFLDLSLRNSASESVLLGHLVTDPSAPIPLQATAHLKSSSLEYQASISATGSFRLPIQQAGVYRLELDLSNSLIAVDNLEL